VVKAKVKATKVTVTYQTSRGRVIAVIQSILCNTERAFVESAQYLTRLMYNSVDKEPFFVPRTPTHYISISLPLLYLWLSSMYAGALDESLYSKTPSRLVLPTTISRFTHIPPDPTRTCLIKFRLRKPVPSILCGQYGGQFVNFLCVPCGINRRYPSRWIYPLSRTWEVLVIVKSVHLIAVSSMLLFQLRLYIVCVYL